MFWLSAENFDGNHPNGEQVITGSATGLSSDSIGNAVSSSGTINVVNDRGHSAYYFDKTNAILSSATVNTQYTFVTVFRSKSASYAGRFFTANEGNRSFASWDRWVGIYYSQSWICQQNKQSTEIEFYIAMNNNGTKNMWDVKMNQLIVQSSTAGANAWGKTVIGKPESSPVEAGEVFVYEALVFDYVLSGPQLQLVNHMLRKKFCMHIR